MPKKQLAVLAAAILLLLAGAAKHNPASAQPLGPDKVNADDMAMGSPSAPVTMIEYYAQGCSVCAAFSHDVFPLLKAKYIDTGKVRYVMRLFPLFPVDGPSYKLSRCVPPEKYFQATETLFRTQPAWDPAEYPGVEPRAGLLKVARVLGMTEAQALACMNSPQRDAAINKVAQDGGMRYRIGGTPTFVINFKKADMQTQSWAEVQAVLNAALAAKGAK